MVGENMNRLKLRCRDYFGRGDIDAFLGLFGDVFSKIASVIGILYLAGGFPLEIVMGRILPGLAVGSIIGSVIYFVEAYALNKKENRTDVTALPFGISSTQVFAWMVLIMMPIYKSTGDAELAWQVALAGCFIGGFIEIGGAFISTWLKQYIPTTALMGNMAASALVWLALNSFFTAFENPIVAVVPTFLIFVGYRYGKNLLNKIPNTLLVLCVGMILAWGTGTCSVEGIKEACTYFEVYAPHMYLGDVVAGISKIVPYLPIIVPLQIANFIATMQSVESASITGDCYPLKKSMVWDGMTTVISAMFGSPFPTSVYYGHPGWKKAGAKSGYSLIMCIPYLGCFLGIPLIILKIIPYEVIVVLLIFVGITVTTEVVDGLRKEYSIVIFISLFPILAQYMSNFLNDILGALGTSLEETGTKIFMESNITINAIQSLSYGAFASSLLYAIWIAFVYERRFVSASVTALILGGLSAIGFIHAPKLQWLPKIGIEYCIVYVSIAAICLVVARLKEKERKMI